jgi:hypothetical protein
MEIIASKHLPSVLRVLGLIVAIGSLFFFTVPIMGIAVLLNGLSLISLSVGVRKKEKWSAVLGLILSSLFVISVLIDFLAKEKTIASIIPFLIPVLILLSFIKFSKSKDLERRITMLPFIVVLLATILSLSGIFISIFDNNQEVGLAERLGILDLNHITSAKDVNLPRVVEGNIWLSGLTSAEGLVLPETVGGGIFLDGLTSAEGLILPETVGRGIFLNGLTSAEGLVLPETVGGGIYLRNIPDNEKEELRNVYPEIDIY